MSEMKRVVVYSGTQYYGEWPPENIMDFRAWLDKKIEAIPSLSLKSATIKISTSGEDAYIAIEYYRPETEEERNAREESRKRMEKKRVADDLRRLRELQEKYGKDAV